MASSLQGDPKHSCKCLSQDVSSNTETFVFKSQIKSINVVAREDKEGEVVEIMEDATNKTDIFFLNPSS